MKKIFECEGYAVKFWVNEKGERLYAKELICTQMDVTIGLSGETSETAKMADGRRSRPSAY